MLLVDLGTGKWICLKAARNGGVDVGKLFIFPVKPRHKGMCGLARLDRRYPRQIIAEKTQFKRECKGQAYKTAEITFLCCKMLCLSCTEPFTRYTALNVSVTVILVTVTVNETFPLQLPLQLTDLIYFG